MHYRVFLSDQFITPAHAGILQFHKNILVIEFPYTGIELQKQVAIPEITQEKTAMTVPDKVFIITKCDVDIFCHIKTEISPCIKIVHTSSRFETFVVAGAGYRITIIDPLLYVGRIPFLVIGEVC